MTEETEKPLRGKDTHSTQQVFKNGGVLLGQVRNGPNPRGLGMYKGVQNPLSGNPFCICF